MPTRKQNDATQLLTQDHRDVEALFEQYEKLADKDGADGEKTDLAQRICSMLQVHATIEEEIFYPASRDAIEEQDLLDEAEVEHASAKDLIAQIMGSGPQEPLYDARVQVLGEYVKHHVKEEEKELFPKVRKTDLDLASLGVLMAERRQELMIENGLAERSGAPA